MPIINNGTTYSDSDIKNFFASNPTNDAIAKQAASMGLTADQIAQAGQIAGKSWTSDDVQKAATGMGYSFGGNGGIISQPIEQGGGAATPGGKVYMPSGIEAGTGGASPGGNVYSGDMFAVGKNKYTKQQLQDFYRNGGNERQFLEQAGISDPSQAHDLMLQARQMAGYTPTMEDYYKQYQQTSPNGAFAKDYAG